MIFMNRVIVVFFLELAIASLIYKEDKICDPKGSNILSFTGFKINRHFTIDGVIPKVTNFISINHCKKGKIDYEKTLRIDSSRDVIWNKPFCILKENDESDFDKNKDRTKFNLTAFDNWKQKWLISKNREKIDLKKLFRYYWEHKLELLTEKLPIHYTSDAAKLSSKDHDANVILKELADNVKCFKLARRKKYAKNDITYYMPNSFVGAIFECPLSQQIKTELLEGVHTLNFLKGFEFYCDESLSTPISPIIADDMTSYWSEKRIFSLRPLLTQKIPYLSSASPFNLRFTISNTPELLEETWAKDIDVNEKYNYSDLELNYISEAVTKTANLLNKMLLPNVLYKVFGNQRKILKASDSENPNLGEKDYFLNKIKNYTSNERLDLLFLSMLEKNDKNNLMKRICTIWDLPI